MIIHKCEYCGKEKAYKSPSLVRRFCCHLCSNKWKWENIRKHGTEIELTCETCNKKFKILKSAYNARNKKCPVRFCSRECYLKFITIKPKKCIQCGNIFTPKDSRINFCCHKCYYKYVKEYKTPKEYKEKVRTGYWYENGYKVLYNNGNSIKEHIFVMQKYIGRKLKPNEVVHHMDGNKTNNDIHNLQLMTSSEHSKLHREKEIKQGKKLFGR
ncbi:MAG: HNH endonuclease [Clostridia bacterium]|nr:HNH endonuclease [Clostridia bacterium]